MIYNSYKFSHFINENKSFSEIDERASSYFTSTNSLLYFILSEENSHMSQFLALKFGVFMELNCEIHVFSAANLFE